MAAYRRVYDSHHLQADCQDQPRNPTFGNRVWATFTFLPFHVNTVHTQRPDYTTQTTAMVGMGRRTVRARWFGNFGSLMFAHLYRRRP